jgi:hypothetical protein
VNPGRAASGITAMRDDGTPGVSASSRAVTREGTMSRAARRIARRSSARARRKPALAWACTRW